MGSLGFSGGGVMATRRWLGGVLESLGLQGLRRHVAPLTADELAARHLQQVEDAVRAAVLNALAGWRAPGGGEFRVEDVYVIDQEYGDVVGQSLWIDLELTGEDARAVPEHYFLRPAPPPRRPGPGASPAEREAYEEHFSEPEEPVPAPLAPAIMSSLEDLERRTLGAGNGACPGARFHVTFAWAKK